MNKQFYLELATAILLEPILHNKSYECAKCKMKMFEEDYDLADLSATIEYSAYHSIWWCIIRGETAVFEEKQKDGTYIPFVVDFSDVNKLTPEILWKVRCASFERDLEQKMLDSDEQKSDQEQNIHPVNFIHKTGAKDFDDTWEIKEDYPFWDVSSAFLMSLLYLSYSFSFRL